LDHQGAQAPKSASDPALYRAFGFTQQRSHLSVGVTAEVRHFDRRALVGRQ
jgi:hypothetical protein